MEKIVTNSENHQAELVKSRTTDGFIPIDKSGFWLFRSAPTRSLNNAAALFNQIQGKTIIEIGTGIHGEISGNSMLVWTRKTSAKRIIAIDLEKKRLDEVRSATQKNPNVELILANGINYLQHFSEKIDLLYLDFWVADNAGAPPGSGRAEAYKEAYIAAKDKMNKNSMILIDDTDHIHPWKHTYIVPLARQDGFEVLYTGRQTLLKR